MNNRQQSNQSEQFSLQIIKTMQFKQILEKCDMSLPKQK